MRHTLSVFIWPVLLWLLLAAAAVGLVGRHAELGSPIAAISLGLAVSGFAFTLHRTWRAEQEASEAARIARVYEELIWQDRLRRATRCIRDLRDALRQRTTHAVLMRADDLAGALSEIQAELEPGLIVRRTLGDHRRQLARLKEDARKARLGRAQDRLVDDIEGAHSELQPTNTEEPNA